MGRCGVGFLALFLLGASLPLRAADESTTKPAVKTIGWFNSTELSVVYTGGNSEARTYGFNDTLRRIWVDQRFKFRADYVRSDDADDWYLLVEPGITFEPGERPTDPAVSLVKPPIEPDTEKIFVEATYDRDFTKAFFWSTGASWDRNEDAGILSRYIGFGTLGNRWWQLDDFAWSTTYGLSYTDREEEDPEPGRETTFAGFRLGNELTMKMGKVTTFESDFTGNISFQDHGDYTLDITNSISVVMGKHLSLKVSLQWLFNNEPALTDVDVIARVVLFDPNGVPGDGDEFFQTVSSGGSELTIGEDPVHKDQLDTIFRTTLVINF